MRSYANSHTKLMENPTVSAITQGEQGSTPDFRPGDIWKMSSSDGTWTRNIFIFESRGRIITFLNLEMKNRVKDFYAGDKNSGLVYQLICR